MTDQPRHLDAVIAGGGVAGLWLLNVLRGHGYSAVLVEAKNLGGEQTLASQGIIHGGLKYSLSGALTAASEAMRDAPSRWRACLEGSGEIDLQALTPLAEHCHLFAGAFGRLAGFFASKAMRGRTTRLDPSDHPAALPRGAFRGSVYRMEDFVLDVGALIRRLASLAQGGVYRHELVPQTCRVDSSVRIELGDETLAANRLILAAGAGNEALLAGLGVPDIPMQRRPLHQAIVRRPGLPELFGHCLTGIDGTEPRLTITSHRDSAATEPNGLLWYLGGRLATAGAHRSGAEQRLQARRELEHCFPWMDWREATIEAHRIDRAEPRHPLGQRPDQAFAKAAGACIVCWPTKLALVPDLAGRVLRLMPPPEYPAPVCLNLPPATPGQTPWGT